MLAEVDRVPPLRLTWARGVRRNRTLARWHAVDLDAPGVVPMCGVYRKGRRLFVMREQLPTPPPAGRRCRRCEDCLRRLQARMAHEEGRPPA